MYRLISQSPHARKVNIVYIYIF